MGFHYAILTYLTYHMGLPLTSFLMLPVGSRQLPAAPSSSQELPEAPRDLPAAPSSSQVLLLALHYAILTYHTYHMGFHYAILTYLTYHMGLPLTSFLMLPVVSPYLLTIHMGIQPASPPGISF